MTRPTTVSLFCGAGGESAGKELAFRDLGLRTQDMLSHAVNHWDLAVATHGANFPHIHVHQEDITEVTARDFGLQRIDLLWASPSCVHHSRARGGKPRDDQQRSHADEVVDRWLRVAQVDVLLVENVPEFAEWGPLDEHCQPIKARKGEFFRAFLAKLEALGYRFEWRILCAADYGDPTTRRRFFMQAVRDGRPIVWPDPTHRDPRRPAGMFDADLPAWRTAAECIDWSIPVPSIFGRKKPLAAATLRRIAAGVVRYVLQGRPFIVNLTHGGRIENIDEPLKTITTANRGEKAVCAASMASLRGTAPDQIQASAGTVEAPIPTISAGGGHAALVAAFLAKHFTGVVGAPLDAPMPTVTATDHNALVAASLMTNTTGHAPTAVNAPVPAITTGNHHALVAAFIQHYYGTGGQHQDPGAPLHTITTLARHGLVTVELEGQPYLVTDIGMRMLEPHELAKAMGFPEGFRFVDAAGKPLTKRDTVKMIGNACPVNTVAALIKAVVLQRGDSFGVGRALASA